LFNAAAIKKLAASAEGLVRRVNILADKSLLAAFAENEYQVTSKHVQAAIGDSEFGAEKEKQTSKKLQWLMWGGLLLLGLALGFAASTWSQKPKSFSTAKSSAKAPQKPAEVEAKISIETPATAPEPKSAGLEANIHAPSSPAQMITATQTEDILMRRLNATTAWLTSQPPTTVSIQLMGASSDEQVKADIEKLSQQIELDNIYVFRTKVNDLPFLTVLYGSFANRFEATQALKNLPAEIQKNRPQLRTIAGVLQETK
jgi:septal ring-binding cell division protein DamX